MATKLEKRNALAQMNQHYGKTILTNSNTNFANINAVGDMWWFDIAVGRVADNPDDSIHLLCYHNRQNRLYHLEIPSQYFISNLRGLVVRKDKATISLELASDAPEMFRDRRSGGDRLRFGQFLRDQIVVKSPGR